MRGRVFTIATAAAAILIMAPPAAAAASTDEPVIMLRVDVNGTDKDTPRVKVSVPLSLIEVVIESVDTTQVMRDLKAEKGIDIRKLWRELKNAEINEFVTIEQADKKVRVFKDTDTFRVTIQ